MLAELLLLCGVAFVSGAINSVAGGGTLLTFPALNHVFARRGQYPGDLAAVVANATSTVALFPGAVAAVWAYRREMAQSQEWIRLLIGPSLLGGLTGSLLLTRLDPRAFNLLVPWLILTAAVLFALQPAIARWTGIGQRHAPATRTTRVGVLLFQFALSVYGGYFGAGIGILMLSGLAILGLSDTHRMNGLKSLLGGSINGIAILVFAAEGSVDWSLAVPMCVAGMLGGWTGAHTARRLNRNAIRAIVVVIGILLASYYFWQQFRGGAS